jgi:hypothetical protein
MKGEGGTLERDPITVLDLRLRELTSSGVGSAALDHLGRVTARSTVVITDQVLLHPVVEYLRRYSSGPFRLVASVLAFARLISESYATLPGTLLEGLAKLLLQDVKLYLYPVPLADFLREQGQGPLKRVTASSESRVVSVDDLRCEPPLDHLLRYLRGAEWIVPLELPPSSHVGDQAGLNR